MTRAESRGEEEPEGLGLVAGRPSVRPIRVDEPPEIDGRLDDDAWQRAAVITRFVQQAPLDGAPATEYTAVYLAYDADHLYFAFVVHYAEPSVMRANRVDRDHATADDTMSVYLDPFLRQQRGFRFDVNGYGVQGDGMIKAGGFQAVPTVDRTWDALFATGAQRVANGYTAEMAIPFKSLRYPPRAPGKEHRWGLQISRTIQHKNQEHAVWAPMSRDEASFLAQMGILEGLTDVDAGQKLELLPTLTMLGVDTFGATTGTRQHLAMREGGLNIKYGLTSSMTADVAINPDYSQVESDHPQIEINQRFPLFFPELRPFFLEGAEIFAIDGPVAAVHTRTIVDPQFAAKVSGKTGRTSLGFLFAGDQAPGRIGDALAPASGQTAHTVIGRMKYDLYTESHVGGIFTNREFLDGYSRLALLDGRFRLGATHALGYRIAGTQHRDVNRVDTTGHLLDVDVGRRGRHLSYGVIAFAISPAFQTDTGFIPRTDQRHVAGNVAYRWWPEHWIVNWGAQLDYERTHDFAPLLQDEGGTLRLDVNFTRNVLVEGNVSRTMERFEGTEFFKRRYGIGGGVAAHRRFAFGGRFSAGDQVRYDVTRPFLGRGTFVDLYLTLRPMSRWESDISLQTSNFVGPVTNREGDFDIQIVRTRSTYQFTKRLGVRNITQFNTWDRTLDLNLLLTYRINGGTALFAGYDDHYGQLDQRALDPAGDRAPDPLSVSTRFFRTNRALFLKLQYLFRS